jgi:hypothetical protein
MNHYLHTFSILSCYLRLFVPSGVAYFVSIYGHVNSPSHECDRCYQQMRVNKGKVYFPGRDLTIS